MIRALIELIISVIVLIAARAILTTVLKGLLTMGSVGQPQQPPGPRADSMPAGRDLYRDPVCGTYVTDATPYRRKSGTGTFFYCSEACLERHQVGAAVRS